MRGDNLTFKMDPFHYHWFSQFAAGNISAITPLYEQVRLAEKNTGIEKTFEGVSSLAKNAYKAQRLIQIEDEILASYGLTWAEFTSDGRTRQIMCAHIYGRQSGYGQSLRQVEFLGNWEWPAFGYGVVVRD
jgi:hypothetical protein